MKTYILDLIPKLKNYSKKLDELVLLTNQHWVVVDDIKNSKTVYIFRENNELLISKNGKVERAKWEYLGNNSLLIENQNESYLFKHGFLDEEIFALKIDSKDEYALLVNENKYEGELDSIEAITLFLQNKYLNSELEESELIGKHIHDNIFTEEKVSENTSEEITSNSIETRELTLKDDSLILIELTWNSGLELGLKVFNKDSTNLVDGIYITKGQGCITVIDSIITSIHYVNKYTYKSISFVIEQQDQYSVNKNDKVYFSNKDKIPNGKLSIGVLEYIIVKDGVIVSKGLSTAAILLIAFSIIFIIFILYLRE